MVNKKQESDFIKLLEDNQNVAHKICRLYTTNSADHKDLFQEISIQLWKAFPKFRGEAKFSTWMYRISLNTAITMYRKSTRRIKTRDIEAVHFKLKDDSYNDQTEEQLKLLYKAIHTLSDIEKALIYLYLENKPYKEIALVLGISEVNARVKMNRAKEKLKKILNP